MGCYTPSSSLFPLLGLEECASSWCRAGHSVPPSIIHFGPKPHKYFSVLQYEEGETISTSRSSIQSTDSAPRSKPSLQVTLLVGPTPGHPCWQSFTGVSPLFQSVSQSCGSLCLIWPCSQPIYSCLVSNHLWQWIFSSHLVVWYFFSSFVPVLFFGICSCVLSQSVSQASKFSSYKSEISYCAASYISIFLIFFLRSYSVTPVFYSCCQSIYLVPSHL